MPKGWFALGPGKHVSGVYVTLNPEAPFMEREYEYVGLMIINNGLTSATRWRIYHHIRAERSETGREQRRLIPGMAYPTLREATEAGNAYLKMESTVRGG